MTEGNIASSQFRSLSEHQLLVSSNELEAFIRLAIDPQRARSTAIGEAKKTEQKQYRLPLHVLTKLNGIRRIDKPTQPRGTSPPERKYQSTHRPSFAKAPTLEETKRRYKAMDRPGE